MPNKTTPLWRVIKVQFQSLNNKDKPREAWVAVGMFDTMAGANAYAAELRATMSTDDTIKSVQVQQVNVDSIETMHEELKAIPFNPPLKANSNTANESANDTGAKAPKKPSKKGK